MVDNPLRAIPPNPLHDAIAAAQFLIDFAQTDLSHATKRELQRLEVGILQAGKWQSTHVGVVHLRQHRPPTASSLAPYQDACRAVFEGVFSPLRRARAERLVLTFDADRLPWGRWRVRVYGSDLHQFQYAVIQLLLVVGEKLRTCAASDCNRWFVKVTKKEYCSTRCQSRTYMRGRRDDEKKERRDVKTTRTR